MTDYLLDTNAFVFLTFQSRSVSADVRSRLAEGRIFISQICAIELAIKHSVGRFPLPGDWHEGFAAGFTALVDDLAADVLPITMKHIAVLSSLPLHHRDPFDRLVISQALAEDMAVLTSDRAFTAYKGLQLLRI